MKERKDYFPVALGILCGIMAALLVLALSNYGAYAEALPSPNVADLVKIDGDLAKSDAPMDLYILPYVPPSIWGALLFDGFHLLHGSFERTGENALRVHFWLDDVARLDGTVGLYLLILAE